MLKQRLLTAAILMPIFIAALFLMDTLSFALFLLVILVFSLFEWANLSAIKSSFTRVVYIAAGVAIVVTIQYYELAGRELFIFVFALWLVVIVRLFRFGHKENGSQSPSGNGRLAWLDGYFVLLPTILGLEILKAQDIDAPQLLLVFFFIIWSADTGAYLAGRTLGKHKLAPRISPGKTIEGLIGGLVGALTIAAIVGLQVWGLPIEKLIYWLLAVVFITLFSLAGDLFESIYKRRAGVKDSGKLLPGHGGLLDRIDSACAALPPYILLLYQFDFLASGIST
ncbi:MAG TPA: phosphatidate cytidylyltransferase [Gammaproteobacteria bacterium]|nr:phosphatidate cytidylyltransferase [Gammaproteobacteria bacterium]